MLLPRAHPWCCLSGFGGLTLLFAQILTHIFFKVERIEQWPAFSLWVDYQYVSMPINCGHASLAAHGVSFYGVLVACSYFGYWDYRGESRGGHQCTFIFGFIAFWAALMSVLGFLHLCFLFDCVQTGFAADGYHPVHVLCLSIEWIRVF